MNASKLVTIAAVIVALGIALEPVQSVNAKPSNTRQMRCIVKVTADADVLPVNFALLESLLRSDAVAGEAARAVWPTAHSTPDAYLHVQPLENLAAEEEVSDAAPPNAGNRLSVGPRTVLFGLQVRLDGDVESAAREFGSALIENLRAELHEAFAGRDGDLKRQLKEAEAQREASREEFEDMLRRNAFAPAEEVPLEPADRAVYEQLERVVDLSGLRPTTSAAEAFETLVHSVEPPLNLVVLWRDLTENAYIDPTSPIEMDGLAHVRLDTALANLLSALSDPLATSRKYRIEYVVNNGVITVATRRGLPRGKMITRVYELPPLLRAGSQAPELAAMVRETIAPESWYDPYLGLGDGTITSSPDGGLIVSQSRDVHIEIRGLLAKVTAEPTIALPVDASRGMLAERMAALMPYREQLEQELDRLQERQAQIARNRSDQENKAMEHALRATLHDLLAAVTDLQGIRADMAKTTPVAPELGELQETTRELATCASRCRETLSKLRNPPSFDIGFAWPGWTEERTVAERIAAKQKDLREVSRRIAEIQRAMTGLQTFDAELNRVRWMAQRCEQFDAQIHDLETRIASLQPCTVTIIGGIERGSRGPIRR